MSHYGISEPSFWDGATGARLAAAGPAAQVVAHYLFSCRAATMIGLYPLSLDVAARQIGSLSRPDLEHALAAVDEAAFAHYDTATEVVWVREMAKFRIGLHRTPINDGDRRLVHVHRLYAEVKPNPFLGDFYRRYRVDLKLPKRRTYQGAWMPLPRATAAPTKTGTDTEVQKIKIKIGQEDQDQRADARPAHAVLTRLAHEVLAEIDAGLRAPREAKDELKTRAARAHLHYDATAITQALDSAEVQRARHRRPA